MFASSSWKISWTIYRDESRQNKATDNQSKWLEALNNQGYVAVVCVGCAQAVEVITKYLSGGK